MYLKPQVNKRIASGLIWAIVIAGLLIRIIVYLQNRNLIIDEANVVRNLYERGFAGLALPLQYEQFAPPVFLWIEKLNTILFGYHEYALRLYPLLCGLASLFLMRAILNKLKVTAIAAWYPLLLLATSAIFIRYSSEVKQYMPDVFIALVLVWCALKWDIEQDSGRAFALKWIATGSIAIWASMPAVFVLAGIGAYYGVEMLSYRAYKKVLPLIFIDTVWLAEFLFYYFSILQPQTEIPGLVSFHQGYFLYVTPVNAHEWWANGQILLNIFWQFGQIGKVATVLHIMLFTVGVFTLLRHNFSKAALLLLPIVAVLAASAVNKYSLIERLCLFFIPLILLVMAYGLQFIMASLSSGMKYGLAGLLAVVGILNAAQMLKNPFRYEQLTDGIQYVKERNIAPKDVCFYHSCGAALHYYTQIHPAKKKWKDFDRADVLPWYTNYDSLAWQIKYVWKLDRPIAFVFTNATNQEYNDRDKALQHYLRPLTRLDDTAVRVVIYKTN